MYFHCSHSSTLTKKYAPKTSSYFTTLCTNFLFMVTHNSTRLNTDCLLAQSLICLHSLTHSHTHTLTHTHTHTHTQVFRTFQQNVCQKCACERQRSPLTPPLLLFSSPPISLFPSGPRQRHAVLFLAYWCFFISQCLFVAQKNYRGLPGCWRQQCRAAEAYRESEKGRESRGRTKKWGIEKWHGETEMGVRRWCVRNGPQENHAALFGGWWFKRSSCVTGMCMCLPRAVIIVGCVGRASQRG